MIYLIYTEEQYTEAEKILQFLTKEKKLTVNSRNKNCSILNSDSRISEDAAIILISNAAVEDQAWQALVDEIAEDVRLVPVSSTRNKDYTHPEWIPPKIKEINYIRIDGNHFKNIWESLTTEKDFYIMKSMLLLNMNTWIFSKYSEDFLLTDQGKIKQYLLLFRQKLQMETHSYFQEELAAIIEYLKLSMQYSKRLRRRKIIDYAKRTGAVILAVIGLVMFFKLRNYTNRLAYTNSAVSIKTHGEIAPITAVKLVESITNPSVPDAIKGELYNTLSEQLNKNWHNTSVGTNYKWTLNDAQIALDERYIWSANENGNIAKWDTYTGKIIEQTNISSQPLLALAADEEESLFVAVDSEGYLYKKWKDSSWEKSPHNYDIPFDMKTDLACNGQKNWAVVAGADGKLLWFDLKSGFSLIWNGEADRIFCTELTDRGLEMVVEKNGSLYDLYILVDGTVEETCIPINADKSCSMDILNGTVVMADSNFQIVMWDKTDPTAIHSTRMVLSRPLYLCFFNDQIIVYHDRNTGTHIYDLERSLDLGSILTDMPVVSSIAVSGNSVMAGTLQRTTYSIENIEPLLPLRQINECDICELYAEQSMTSDGMIRQVSIENEYMIRVALHAEENDKILMIDGANRYDIGKSQRDESLVQEDSPNIFYYADKPVNFTGKPTITGITNDGRSLLIGSSDGSFSEITFSEPGDYLLGAQLQIPSHAAVISICQTSDCYYLEDATGTFWRVRIGYDSLTPEGAALAVKEKLHCAATEEIREAVSQKTLETLGVVIVPGGGNKEWE